MHADSIAALRARPASEVLEAALKGGEMVRFTPTVDGYVLPRPASDIHAEGKQSHVPLLAGWNADEMRSGVVFAKEKPTARSFAEEARTKFGDSSDAFLKVYAAGSDAEALESASALAGDLLIGYATWKWIDVHARTGNSPVYRYSFDRDIPVAPDTKINGTPATSRDIGARHAGEIEYVFGTLDSVPNVSWQPEDRKLSDLMMSYWTNFARSGDPNGVGLPEWPKYSQENGYQVQHLDVTVHASPDTLRPRYEFLDAYAAKKGSQ
jgi:para-nitrobenzyl esterase